MAKLYEIITEYDKLLSAIADNDGEISDHLGASIAETKEEFNEKAMNICYIIKNLEPDAVALKTEGQRLKDRAKAMENKIEGLKDFLKDGMRLMKINEVKGEILTVKIRPSPPSCIVLDDKVVPPEFIRVIPETKEVNRKAVIQAYKERDEIVPGTEISVGTTLTIR